MLMLNPRADAGLNTLLDDWGVVLDDRLVLDTSGAGQFVGLGPAAPIVTNYGDHPITREFGNGRSFFPLARPVESRELPDTTTTPLLFTDAKVEQKPLPMTVIWPSIPMLRPKDPYVLGVALSRPAQAVPPMAAEPPPEEDAPEADDEAQETSDAENPTADASPTDTEDAATGAATEADSDAPAIADETADKPTPEEEETPANSSETTEETESETAVNAESLLAETETDTTGEDSDTTGEDSDTTGEEEERQTLPICGPMRRDLWSLATPASQ
jgi:ABC-type uncharacterized transport system involved in gliding motility auxiliary subunit